MDDNQIDGPAASRWTRRGVIGLAAAVPALVVPALLGPVSTAEAKGRPMSLSGTSLTLAPVAQQLAPGLDGVPGVRFQAVLVETDDYPGGMPWQIHEFAVNGVSYLSKLHPQFIGLGDETVVQKFDVTGLDATGTVRVDITYSRGTNPVVTVPTTPVLILPAQALGGVRPPRPPRPLRPPRAPRPPRPRWPRHR